jgi:hypothetical protein
MADEAPASIGLATIVKELRSLREQRVSGTYYIVSADNRQVRFGVSSGEVNALSVRAPNLSSALDAIAGLRIMRTSFAKDGLAMVTGNFGFSTEELIHGLLDRAGHPVPAASKAATGASVAALSQAQHVAIKKALIEYLGPIGEFVYEEHQQTSGTPKNLLTNLAREIPDGSNAEQFLAKARLLLQKAS